MGRTVLSNTHVDNRAWTCWKYQTTKQLGVTSEILISLKLTANLPENAVLLEMSYSTAALDSQENFLLEW